MAQALVARPRAARAFAITRAPRTRSAPRHAHALLQLLISKWRLQRIEVNRLLLQLLSGELLACPPVEQTQSLQALRAELVDYVSTGHFKIYGRILPRAAQRDPELHALVQHILRSIGRSTDLVLGFNDRVAPDSGNECARPIRPVLVRLSRALQLRFALEEQLLDLCGH